MLWTNDDCDPDALEESINHYFSFTNFAIYPPFNNETLRLYIRDFFKLEKLF